MASVGVGRLVAVAGSGVGSGVACRSVITWVPATMSCRPRPIGCRAASAYATAVDEGLAWSPDSSRIAYRSSGGINVIGADGTNPRKVVSGFARGRMAWSPDGTRITYTTYRDTANSYTQIYRGGSRYSAGGIWVIDADGTNKRQLTTDRDLRPVWVISSG